MSRPLCGDIKDIILMLWYNQVIVAQMADKALHNFKVMGLNPTSGSVLNVRLSVELFASWRD